MHALSAVELSPGSHPQSTGVRRNRETSCAASPVVPSPRSNHILAALTADSGNRINANLDPVTLAVGATLCEAGRKRSHVYFPTTSIVSLLCGTEDGSSLEICSVGNEGVVGFWLFTGGETTGSRAVVSCAGDAYRLPSHLLGREFSRGGALMQVLLRYTQVLLTQIGQTAVCNRHHAVEKQLCRRLLASLDRVSGDELAMTHEQLAHILGVRRECITEVAGRLQAAGLIRYARGRIKILRREGLLARACECYNVVRHESERLMSGAERVVLAD